jgi:glutaredoxin
MSETLKKIKISDMTSDLTYKLSTAEFMANSFSSNKPFVDLYAQEVNINELVYDLSVTDKLYVYISNKNMTATYSTSELGDWEKTEVNPSNLNHIIGYNHMYYNNEMIISQHDCDDCKKTKALIDLKKYPLMLINKDKKAIAALHNLPNVDDENKIILSIFLQKNSINYEFK